MMGVGSWGGFKSCLYVPQMASARSQSTLLNQSAIPLLSTRRLRWIIFVPIENFFLPPFFLLFLWRTMSPSVLALFSWVLLFLNSTLLPLIPYFCVCICRTLQTVGPSHARTYTVAVYFKGERIGCGKGPRWVRQYNIIRQQDKALHFSVHR